MRHIAARHLCSRVCGACRGRAELVGLAVLIATLTAPLGAQTLNGTVRDSLAGTPVVGAVITVLDSARTVRARTLSDQHGAFRLLPVSDGRMLRVVRIGFQPTEVELDGAPDASRPLAITMRRLPSLLMAVRVRDQSPCGERSDATAAFALWDQARAALLNSVVVSENDPPTVDRVHFERIPDGHGHPIAQAVAVDAGAVTTRPFAAARSAGAFVDSGFAMTIDSTDERTYFAPDAETLMDDRFLANYCVSIARSRAESPHEEGVAFRPYRTRDGRIDVEGAVWVDTVSRAVSSIEFRYVGLDRKAESMKPGGAITLREMPNGAVIVQRWSLRVPAVRVDTEYLGRTVPGAKRQMRLSGEYYPKEFGGEVASAEWRDGTSWVANDLGSLRVRLSHPDGGPAQGLDVRLRESPYTVVTDSAGIAVFYDLLPGPYEAEIRDTVLSRAGILLESGVGFVVDSLRPTAISLVVPTVQSAIAGLCPHDTSTTLQLIAGRLYSLDGKPLDRVTVTLIEAPAADADSTPPLTATTDAAGRYHVCRNARTTPFLLTATSNGARLATLQDSVPMTTRVDALDLHEDAQRAGVTILRKSP